MTAQNYSFFFLTLSRSHNVIANKMIGQIKYTLIDNIKEIDEDMIYSAFRNSANKITFCEYDV